MFFIDFDNLRGAIGGREPAEFEGTSSASAAITECLLR
jgi:hypothetical protein